MKIICRFSVEIQANDVMCETFGEDAPGYMQRNFQNTEVLDFRNLCSNSDALVALSLLDLSSSDWNRFIQSRTKILVLVFNP